MANGIVNNGRYRKDARRKLALERQEYRNNLSSKKQLARLDARLEGTNVGAVKERARLQKLLAQSN